MGKKINASAIGGGIVTIAFLIMLFGQAGDNPVYFCENTEDFCIARDGISSGQHTRCYNETNMNWWEAPYCSEGWIKVENDLNQTNGGDGFTAKEYTCPPNGKPCVEVK